MSFFLFLRDKVVPSLFFFCIIFWGWGGIVWLFGQAYFWNTSDVTYIVDEEVISVKMDIAARIIYRDFSFFQSTYPFHITLPYSRELDCKKECTFVDIPAGDARVTFVTQSGAQLSEQISILSDTRGSIDMRIPIRVKEIALSEVVKNVWDISKIDIDPESIFYQNTTQGLWLFYKKGLLFLYDVNSGQNILLENDMKVRSVARGMQEGTYYLTTDANDVFFFDRYGRQKTEKVTHSLLRDQDLVWELRDEDVTTKLLIGGKERIFFGRLFWFMSSDKQYLFDGEKVFEIINN